MTKKRRNIIGGLVSKLLLNALIEFKILCYCVAKKESFSKKGSHIKETIVLISCCFLSFVQNSCDMHYHPLFKF